MGGMLATRFALMYPQMVTKLILEDPLGLEDYKKFIPFQPIEALYKNELKATYASYKKYQESYYPDRAVVAALAGTYWTDVNEASHHSG